MTRAADTIAWVKAWIWLSATASAAGWLLSGIGQLNRTGYAAFAAAVVALFAVTCAQRGIALPKLARWPQWRFRRFFPVCFLILAGLVLAGGVLYAPTNHAGLTYRVPRVLQWFTEDQWFWIHTPNYRMNNRACGMEWLSAPLLLFTKSDRPLFLLNFIPFLFLPGQIFSLFSRLGVKARVAWYWMWILPTGYSFLLQAGSLANDTFPTVYALAAVDFALRARRSGRASEAWYSVIAAALLTGAKASNLPLLLPWAIALAPSWKLLFRPPLLAPWLGGVAVLVSFIPTAALNIAYCGTWSGLNLERTGMEMKNPVVGLWGNALLFLLHNFVPPFFPFAGGWNSSAPAALPTAITEPLNANFEAGYHLLWELPTEDWVGLGFGVSVLWTISILAGWWLSGRSKSRAAKPAAGATSWWRPAILVAPWFALGAYCVKSGMVTGARLISPYYPLVAPLLLLGAGQVAVVRRKWWRATAALLVLLCIPVVVVTPARPLFPALTLFSRLAELKPENRLLTRAHRAYAVYRGRSDPLAAVRALLPPDVRTVGFLADGDDMDLSLWRPFFQRQVKHVLLQDSGEAIRRRGIEWVVVGGAYLAYENADLEDWLRKVDGQRVASTNAIIKVSEGPQPWHLIRLK